MKKLAALLCVTALTLSLSACGAGTASSSAASSSTLPADASAVGSSASSSETTGRPEHSTITMNIEGDTEEVPATLYQGDGWSIYIPDDGWAKDVEKDQWKANENDLVLMGVWEYSGLSAEEGRKEVLGQYGESYGFQDLDADNFFSGYDGENDTTMSVQMVSGSDGVYAVWNSCPAEAAEGFGARLSAIAATFEAD